MALTTAEIRRLKYEMGWNLLQAGAEYYIGVAAIFDQVVGTYLTAGASTTSTTTVTAVTPPSGPALVTLTLADATGFSRFDRAIVDVDGRQEGAVIENVSGSTISLLLANAHSGTYPVTVEGGESVIRDLLSQLYKLGSAGGRMDKAAGSAGVKKADEVEFFGGAGAGKTRLESLAEHREYLRDELWRAIFGQGRAAVLASYSGGGGGSVSVEPY